MEIKKYPLLFLVILSLTGVMAYITITGGYAKSIPGATEVPYPIYSNNDEPFSGFQVDVNYDPNYLTYSRIEPSSLISSPVFVINDETPGFLKIIAVSEGGEIPPRDEKIFDIIFDVDAEAVSGEYLINLSDFLAANIDVTILISEAAGGIFEIVKPYEFEFLPPITNTGEFTLQDGATLPLKFSVSDINGSFVADDSVLVRIYNENFSKIYNASGEGSDYIRIDETGSLYIINIHTKNLGLNLGVYNIEVSFDNFQTEEILFELVEKGQGKGKQV